MKALSLLLQSEDIDPIQLRVLCESDGRTAYVMDVDAHAAQNAWQQFRDLVPRSGRWPLLLSAHDQDFPQPEGPPAESYEQTVAAARGGGSVQAALASLARSIASIVTRRASSASPQVPTRTHLSASRSL